MQTQLNGFENYTPNDLQKLVVEYSSTNCETMKVCDEYKFETSFNTEICNCNFIELIIFRIF